MSKRITTARLAAHERLLPALVPLSNPRLRRISSNMGADIMPIRPGSTGVCCVRHIGYHELTCVKFPERRERAEQDGY